MAKTNQQQDGNFFSSFPYHSDSVNSPPYQYNCTSPTANRADTNTYNIKSKTTTSKFKLLSYNIQHPASQFTTELHSSVIPPITNDLTSIQKHIIRKCELQYGISRFCLSDSVLYLPVASSMRDRIIRNFSESPVKPHGKHIYIIASSYSYGNFLKLNLINTNLENSYRIALQNLGFSLQEILLTEDGLSYNGYDTYASNMLSTITTLGIKAKGYGIKSSNSVYYHSHHSLPAYHNYKGFSSPWEIPRSDIQYEIQLFGAVKKEIVNHRKAHIWYSTINVKAVAYDLPITGYLATHVNYLRLWKSIPIECIESKDYNELGSIYFFSHMISDVSAAEIEESKEFKFIQGYFLASASIQDILKESMSADSTKNAFNKVAIHSFDVGPAIVAVELMRILMDVYDFTFKDSLSCAKTSLSITLQQISLSQLPSWSIQMVSKILPRHYQLIHKIAKLSKISEQVHLRKLDIVNGAIINPLHLIAMCFKCIVTTSPDSIKHFINSSIKPIHDSNYTKIINITAGASYSLWTLIANNQLISIVSDFLSNELIVQDAELLEMLHCHSENEDLQQKWNKAKYEGKKRIKHWASKKYALTIATDALYDLCQAPFEEPYRILLNILQIFRRYRDIQSGAKYHKKVYFIGKIDTICNPLYSNAMCSMITAISDVINNDQTIGDSLKLIFIPHITQATIQLLAPGIDICQCLALTASDLTAIGMMMNGCHCILSRVGIHKEIYKRMQSTVLLFGADEGVFQQGKCSTTMCDIGMRKLIDDIGGVCESECVRGLLGKVLCGDDWFWLRNDYISYMEAVRGTECRYGSGQWTMCSIRSFSGVGYLCSDRAVIEYLKYVW